MAKIEAIDITKIRFGQKGNNEMNDDDACDGLEWNTRGKADQTGGILQQ